MKWRSRRRALLLALTLLMPAAACQRSSGGVPEAFPGASVVLISIDTLRSDHLPFYGYGGVETPALSGLRGDSILYERAYSPVPLTLPAHVSLFTGRLPEAHGVHDNAGYNLKPDVPTLTELLKKGGFRTGGAVSAFVLGGSSGIGRGFDFFEDGVEPIGSTSSPSLIQRPGGETAALLEKWIDAQGDARFFAFLHLYEPHSPYEPAEPYRTRYSSSPYDGEIATADAIVGSFLEHLKKAGLYDRSLVICLSDHGESLGEHGEDEHGILLYRSVLQVPLLVKLPGNVLAGSSVKAPVQLTDVFTTIGQVTGTPGFPSIDGTVSLVALAGGTKVPVRSLYSETYFPRLHYGWSNLASAISGPWHYVDAPAAEFYDMEGDPGETRNVLTDKPGPLRAMTLDLEKRRTAFEAPGPVSDEERKKLASLGYLSTGARAGTGKLPDPKEEIGTVRVLREAMAAVAAGRPLDSLPVLEGLLKRNPAMGDVWGLYSEALLAVGRPEHALAASRKAVELAPATTTMPLLSVANLCLRVGQPDEALRNAELALDRGDLSAHEAMARCYLAKGDLARAEQSARQALAVPRIRKRAHLALAHIAAARQDYPGALAQLDEIRPGGTGGELAGAHYLRGDVLARTNRFDEAAAEFQEEIRLFPSQSEAWVGLALTRASQSRIVDAKKILASMVSTVGTAEAYGRACRALTFLGDRPLAEVTRRRGLALFPGDPNLRALAEPRR
jgi:tetratricopeptide (TPR) repeat protein